MKRIADQHLARCAMTRTAGEVIFKKDRSGEPGQWAYGDNPPSDRVIPRDYNYSIDHQKPLAYTLRSTLASLGHSLAAYNRFARLKSAKISPDGSLGGRGYIQRIVDMRKQYMNCVEALSSLADTLYDELNAPHWALLSRQQLDTERAELEALLEDADEIRKDPEQWAEDEMEEVDENHPEAIFGRDEDDYVSIPEAQDRQEEPEDTMPFAWLNPALKQQAKMASTVADRWLVRGQE